MDSSIQKLFDNIDKLTIINTKLAKDGMEVNDYNLKLLKENLILRISITVSIALNLGITILIYLNTIN